MSNTMEAATEEDVADDVPTLTATDMPEPDPTGRKSSWFKKKISNNNTKYTLNGSTKKITLDYFAVEGSEGTRYPVAGNLAKYLTQAKEKSSKKVYFGYDEKRGLGFKEETTNEKNKESIVLPYGAYTYHIDPQTGEEGFVPFSIRIEKYVDVDGALESTKKSINKFIEKKAIYKSNNLMYKLGIMMFGSPGQGKSSVVRHLISECLPKESIVLYVHGLPSMPFLQKVHTSLGDTLKVFIFEEFTEVEEKTARSGQTDKLLQFLDGEYSLDNSIILATTNYPEKLPENMVNRPGRFDKLTHFGNPGKEAIKMLLKEFLGREVTEEEVKEVDGLSIAAIKEVCMMNKIEDIPFIESSQALKDRKKLCRDQFKKSNESGFGIRSTSR